MSAEVLLHCQDEPLERFYTDEVLANPPQRIVGLELTDGTFLRSRDHGACRNVKEVALTWPDEQIEELASFYDHFLTRPPESDKFWNCHTFAAAVMCWSIELDEGFAPFSMPCVEQPTEVTQLKNGRPYGIITKRGLLAHSMIGVQSEGKSFGLGIRAIRSPLYLDNSVWINHAARTDVAYEHTPPGLISDEATPAAAKTKTDSRLLRIFRKFAG